MTETHTKHGKWSQPGVPHKGWTCVGDDDLGEPSQLCEMCESIEIRYVHFMEHPEYRGTLGVGCVCAEHMEEDRIGPRLRERALKSKARRRKTWSTRTWKVSTKGNSYINMDGYNITVVPRGTAWGLIIVNGGTGKKQIGRKTYPTQEVARSAAFDALVWAKENL